MPALRCGYVGIAGRPNVGKSTLLNALVGSKLSIASSKPQTTRHAILGIATGVDCQAVYVDTPGLTGKMPQALHRHMQRVASHALADVDVLLWVVQALCWTEGDEYVQAQLSTLAQPVILVINQIDRSKDKRTLLPYLKRAEDWGNFSHIVPVSARTRDNLALLERRVAELLPQQEFLYPDDQITDRSVRFLAAEFIREALFHRLGQELPYTLTVEIERYEETPRVVAIDARIWVARPGHKAIVIGEHGMLLKSVGQAARLEIEKLIERRVYLRLWVRVQRNWADQELLLQRAGYTEG